MGIFWSMLFFGIGLLWWAYSIIKKFNNNNNTRGLFGWDVLKTVKIFAIAGAAFLVVGIMGLIISDKVNGKPQSTQQAQSRKIPLTDFITAYNENAEKFNAVKISEGEHKIKNNEKNNTIEIYMNNASTLILAFSKDAPSVVYGMVFSFIIAVDDPVLTLLVLYSIIKTFDPEYTENEIIRFGTNIFENEGEKVSTKNNISYEFKSGELYSSIMIVDNR